MIRASALLLLSVPVGAMLVHEPTAGAVTNAVQTAVAVRFGGASNSLTDKRIAPERIQAKVGQSLDFTIRGFHQVMVYKAGTRLEDLQLPAADDTRFVNDLRNVFHKGADPEKGGQQTSEPALRSRAARTAVYRTESVTFDEPGEYLVICNVYPHFREGMHGRIVVTRE